jgi:iron complex outermembrane receptor protein
MRNVNGAMLLRFHKWSFVAVTLLGGGLVQNAFAQSTGTEATEEDMTEVVVSATRVKSIGNINEQTAPKSRITVSGDYLKSQLSGQSLFQSLNQVPGVNFTNSDPTAPRAATCASAVSTVRACRSRSTACR